MLQILTAQAAISIENARLYQQVENYSHTLEAEVECKTEDLRHKTRDLEQALQNLQKTQAQLIQSEKMSALGQLVAGVAHEINNPITFINSNVHHAQHYVSDLLELVQMYRAESAQPSPALQAKEEEIELDFIKLDLTKILQSMKVGSQRIAQIVMSLRNFSRLDESDLKEADIHQGLDNTLLILQHRLKATSDRPEIALVKDYDSSLPLLNCYPSQLNQVFLNILTNAIDAFTHAPAGRSLQIGLSTHMGDGNTVGITIADNGAGMSESIRHKVFDPFFTTKPVGQGTGLGLAISYQIVTVGHGGRLYCTSEPGIGTQFTIELPV